MSTRELAYTIFDSLTEEQLEEFIRLFRDCMTNETPNEETRAAMLEADKIGRDASRKRYSSFSEILTEIDSEDDD